MRLLISYLKEKLPVIGVYAVMLVIFCILLWLKEVPFDVIGYGAELSAIWLLFVGALNFWFYRKRYQSLLDLSAALPHELKEFPDPKSRIEAEYQEITETIFAWREMLENEVLLSKKDASDYYSLWVHQIKTPISAMHLLIQSFEEQAMEFEEHAEETLNFLNEMKMKIFQTEEYVGMVLSYLRMEDMGNDLKFQWYPIGDIVRQAVRKYSQIFILKKIHLNFQDSRQMVLTDEKWLLFVIEQVLSNALKYTSSDEIRPPKAQGMGSPDGDTEKGCISIYIKGTELVVEDTGIGIAPEDLPRIFERGFTGYNGREHQKSTGIGLYLCKTIIQKLGHSIRAQSRVGVGTKIYISLEREDVKELLYRAVRDEKKGMGSYEAELHPDAADFLADVSGGDARGALNALELGILTTGRSEDGKIHITLEVAQECIQKRAVRYDKDGDNHYDTISAFIKSMRGSDPDAAVYYLARMLNSY